MYTDLTNLQSDSNANFGGMPYFLFAPREWLAAPFYPNLRTRIVDAAVSLAAGKSWLEARCLVNTMVYDEREKQESAGSYYEGILSGAVMKDDATKINLTDTLRFHDFIVIYYDRNNIGRIIGNHDAGMRFLSEFSTGAKGMDDNRYLFTLRIELAHRAPLYLPGGSGADPNNPSS